MNICHSPTWESNTESAVTLSANGSKDWDCEQNQVSHQDEPAKKVLSSSIPAPSREPISSSGMHPEQPTYWMPWAIPDPFSKRSNGSIGWEILDADGRTIAWTTNGIMAERICELLNRNETE